MVSPTQSRHTAPLPPPICPRCGHHRTQVVGRSDDGAAVVIRCSACGERSVVGIGEDDRPAAGPWPSAGH